MFKLNKKIILLISLISLAILISGCGKEEVIEELVEQEPEPGPEPEPEPAEEIVEEVEEEATFGISANYVLSQKDCKCYSITEEVPEGALNCEVVFGLAGCSDAGIEVKSFMLDGEGNIEEKYREQLGV